MRLLIRENFPTTCLEARFGHGANVSKQHYCQPLHGLQERGATVEGWLGELRDAMAKLGLALAGGQVAAG